MKSIMSINRKFFKFSPSELYDLVGDYDVDGFEISIDYDNHEEVEYLKELAFICNKNNLRFQVHGNSSLSIDKQLDFFEVLEGIYDFLGYKINVVLHSKPADTYEESVIITTDYLNELTSLCNNDKIVVSLENLNDIVNEDRLNKSDITPIVANNENIFMTYDIGHEIVEYGSVTNLNKNIIPLITNIHIHTINYDYVDGFDHKPIFKNDMYWTEIMKGISFLKVNHYDGPIVFEYDVYCCPGNDLKEKIISYAKSMKFVSERFK